MREIKGLEAVGRRNPDNDTLASVCKIWNESIDIHCEIRDSDAFSKRFYELRYEHLVTDPQQTLGALFGFLGLAVESQLLHPEGIGSDQTGELMDGIYYDESSYTQAFNPARIGRWRSELSAIERLTCHRKMRRNLRRMGYI